MTLKQAKRWYEFGVGQIVEDIDGSICVRTLDGKLHAIDDDDERNQARDQKGFLCSFWINKKSGALKNVGTAYNEPKLLTEAEVQFIWEVNFRDCYSN